MSLRFRPGFISLSAAVLSIIGLVLIVGARPDRSAAAKPIEISAPFRPIGLQSTAAFTIELQLVDNGLTEPVYVTNAQDDSDRLFVVERAGRIRVIKNGATLVTPFLNISSRVESASFDERGLLSMAFDPNYKSNGTFYVYYTTKAAGHVGDIVIARYQVANPAADTASVLTVTNILTISHPDVNHNGGQLQFGVNDNYLYVGTGDGGGGGDDHGVIGNGQNLNALLGKILRIDVHGVPTYTLPPSNPFTQTVGAKKEIWAYGLRNPWRFSFDRSTGDVYIGDVGQDCYEEIDYQPANSHGGENYGWRLMEGFHYFDRDNPNDCSQAIVAPGALITLTRPITDYYHGVGDSNGSAVSGGYIYRGLQYPWLNGTYFFADYGSGKIWLEQQTAPDVWSSHYLRNADFNVSSFGEDQNGEVYAADIYGGAIYKLISSQPTDYSKSIKMASNSAPHQGDVITYAIVLRNSGTLIANTGRVTDVIPIGLSYVNGSFTATRGTIDASGAPTLKWSGVMSNVSIVTLTYAVTVSINTTQALINTATINPDIGSPFTRSATIVVNGLRVYLPLLLKNY
jgi:uncharacterized repeat protein (TIGR01451 family)